MNGTLFIVATPIGNLSDMTFRAVEVLKTVDMIACEDTRQTKKLLDHYTISTPTISYHQHSKIQKIDSLISELLAGKNIALVSDAGTPGISDPGGKLVETAHQNNISVVSVPGASALTAALSVSGFPTDRFTFYGFVPHKKGRQTLFAEISQNAETSAFYESTHRIVKTLEQLKVVLESQRQIFVARELTKKFESAYRGTINEVLKQLQADNTKGEFVVIVRGK